MFAPQDHYMDHGWGWWFLGGIVPIVLLLAVVGLIVWTGSPPEGMAAAP